MAVPFLRVLKGKLTVVGKSPDGDSIRFIPARPALLDDLYRGDRVRASRVDGSVQLRLEGVDSPETHYGGDAQPHGEPARDWLLEQVGFTDVVFDQNSTVQSADPATRPATILSKGVDPNGRPIAYLLAGDDGDDLRDGTWSELETALLDRTLNARSLAEGLSYLTLYTSTPAPHRTRLRRIAGQAREAGKGVWAVDETAMFKLADQTSISPPNGALILPKLFRRCTDYLEDRADGFRGTLPDWLVSVSASGTRPEDDQVLVGGSSEVRLSALVKQLNDSISFTADLLDIVFVEK
jgi:endonuclease YncB( thermonuclease family)